MWQVFENDKPADTIGFPELCGTGWETSKWCTFQQALTYMRKWLGPYAAMIPDYIDEENDYSICYNGYDVVSIRKVPA